MILTDASGYGVNVHLFHATQDSCKVNLCSTSSTVVANYANCDFNHIHYKKLG